METVRDLFNSVKSYLAERLTNPLYGAFLLAWTIFNFRLVLVLIGDGTWREKITYIDSRLYPHWTDWALHGYVVPLLVGLAYVVLSPFVNRWTTMFLRQRESITLTKLLEIDGQKPLPKPEADQLRKILLSERESRITEQQESAVRETELSAQLDLLAKENKTLKARLAEPASAETPQTLAGRNTVAAEKALDGNNNYALLETDFIGVQLPTVQQLVSRGVSEFLAKGLYAIRNGKQFSELDYKRMLELEDEHKFKVLLNQLKGLGLVSTDYQRGTSWYVITSAGTQALEAAMKRGFVPQKA